MGASFRIAGRDVAPGSQARMGIPIARLFTQQMLEIPVIVVHGARPGPAVWLSAAIHGDEIHGSEIIRRVVDELDPQGLRGTVVGVPVVNVMGFLQQSRYLPDRRDLNRCFPGSLRGSLASRMACLLLQEVVLKCAYGIDLHAGSDHRTNAPQARGDLGDERVLELARAFAAPFAVHSGLRRGSLRAAAAEAGIPCILYEASETLRMDPYAIRAGADGILRVLAHLEMIDTAPVAHPGHPHVSRRSRWVRSSRSGILHLDARLGQFVHEQQVIGVVRDIYGDVAARIRAQVSGAVIGHTLNPLVNRGDAVVHLAEFESEPGSAPPAP